MVEATDNVAWPLLKNRVLTSNMNTWPPLAGCLLTPPQGRSSLTNTAVKDGDYLSDRLWGGHCCICPAVLRDHPRALFHPETP